MGPRRAPKRAVWRRRRAWPWAATALVLLAVAGWEGARLLAHRRAPPLPARSEPQPETLPPPVHGALAEGGEVLVGTVVDVAGQPVAGARVSLAVSDAAGVVGEACPGGETALLLCEHPASALRLEELLVAGADAAVALTADTDAAGRFRFEHLRPAAFTVQADAPVGWALAERAPPGVPLRLLLRPYRALEGRAVDEGGQPVARARVRLMPGGPGPVREAVSGADGAFRVEGAAQSPFALLVDAAGFLPSVAHPVSPEAGAVRLARPRALNVRTAGAVPAELTARVRSVARPVPGAGAPLVHLVRQVEVQGGEATFANLPPGEVEVELLGAAVHGGPLRVLLREPVTSIALGVKPSGAATVAVVDAQGRPVQECVVALRVPGAVAQKATAASCEAVELEPVPPGDYLLSAEAPGFRRSERPVHLATGPAALELQLDPALALSGRVLDGAGFPVGGVSLVVSPIGAVTRSDRAGTFRVSVPGAGLYSVEAQHSELGGAERAVTAPDADVILRLQPRSVLELEVLAGGRPLEGALAVLFDVHDTGPGGQYQADRATGADGRVRLIGFPPGTYTIGVMHPGAGSPPRQEVVLSEGTTRSVTLHLPAIPSGSITGEVVDETGRAVESVSVGARPFDAPAVSTDGEGRFRLSGLREGVEYKLTATLAGAEPGSVRARAGETSVRIPVTRGRHYSGRVVDESGAPVHAFRVGGSEVESEDGRFAVALRARDGTVAFSVEAPPLATARVRRPADRTDLGDIVLHRAPLVQGRVQQASGQPVAEALVVCEGCLGEEGPGPGRRLWVLTGPDGRFVVPVSAPSGVLVRLLAMKDGRVAWAEAGRAGEEATLTLEAPAPVHGRVLGPGGVPRPGVAVVFRDPLLDPVLLVTGADGAFSGDVAPGVYQVSVLQDASQPHRSWTVRVPTDRPVELVVTGRREVATPGARQ